MHLASCEKLFNNTEKPSKAWLYKAAVLYTMVVEIMNEGSEKYKFAKNLRWHSYSRMHYANHQVWEVSTEFRYLYFHSIIQFFF